MYKFKKGDKVEVLDWGEVYSNKKLDILESGKWKNGYSHKIPWKGTGDTAIVIGTEAHYVGIEWKSHHITIGERGLKLLGTGQKTEFPSGAIRDSQEGKEDYIETYSFTAMKRYAQYMTGKKSKYGAGNFKKGIPIESYEASLMRHVQKYFENKYENGQTEREEDHLSAILFNVFGIMHEEGMSKKLAKG